MASISALHLDGIPPPPQYSQTAFITSHLAPVGLVPGFMYDKALPTIPCVCDVLKASLGSNDVPTALLHQLPSKCNGDRHSHSHCPGRGHSRSLERASICLLMQEHDF